MTTSMGSSTEVYTMLFVVRFLPRGNNFQIAIYFTREDLINFTVC